MVQNHPPQLSINVKIFFVKLKSVNCYQVPETLFYSRFLFRVGVLGVVSSFGQNHQLPRDVLLRPEHLRCSVNAWILILQFLDIRPSYMLFDSIIFKHQIKLQALWFYDLWAAIHLLYSCDLHVAIHIYLLF